MLSIRPGRGRCYRVIVRLLLVASAISAAAIPECAQAYPQTAALSHSAGGRQPHPAVARIIVPQRGAVSFGSGTLVGARQEQGLVVTNWHVVRGAAGPIQVVFPGGFRSTAKVLSVDQRWDLAALLIRRPPVSPIPIARAAPRRGEPITIAGYGGGDYRAATGRVTQYVAPGLRLPYEMVEVSVQARQGDSGGPMLNGRGELAGVLFGAARGTTSGSYAGRVRKFLTPLWSDLDQTPAEMIAGREPPRRLPAVSGLRRGDESITRQRPEPRSAPPAVAANRPAPRRSRLSLGPPVDAAASKAAAAANRSSAAAARGEAPSSAGASPPPAVARRSPVTLGPPGRIEPAEQASERGDAALPARPPVAATATGPATARAPNLEPEGAAEPALFDWGQLVGRTPWEKGKSALAFIGLLAVLVLLARGPEKKRR